MIQLNGAGKRYGPKILFEDVDWLVTPNERTGLVGANGTGKSSLLKVLAGIEGLDSGSVTTQKGVTLGYLPQEGLSLSGRTVFAECMTVFADLRALEDEQEQLAHRMAELDPASPEYAQVADRFHQREGRIPRARRLRRRSPGGHACSPAWDFPQRDWKRRTEEFSGGWQMRIALAKLLLEKPNLLLLDEPTNHLDLEARNWLEDYLDAYPYAVVLVSHDRYFLDVTVRKIAELWNKGLHFYTGGFTRYEEQKTERRAQLTGRLPEPARPHRAARSLHQPLPLPGHQGQAGAEPHQGAGKDRAHRNSAGREGHPLQFSAAQTERPHRGGVPRRRQELRRSHGLLRRGFLSSSAATAWRWWASTAPANRP